MGAGCRAGAALGPRMKLDMALVHGYAYAGGLLWLSSFLLGWTRGLYVYVTASYYFSSRLLRPCANLQGDVPVVRLCRVHSTLRVDGTLSFTRSTLHVILLTVALLGLYLRELGGLLDRLTED